LHSALFFMTAAFLIHRIDDWVDPIRVRAVYRSSRWECSEASSSGLP
jgi:hypothetical protein